MRRRRPEDTIQRAVLQHLAVRPAGELFAFHVANGGRRLPIEAAILKGLGVKAGVPDLVIIKAGHTYALELKAPRGRTSDAQADTIQAMQRAGATVAVAVGLDYAIARIEGWGLLRGVTQFASC
jgi:hypothetical protein